MKRFFSSWQIKTGQPNLGYTNLTSEAVVADIEKAHPVDTAKEGDEVIICANQTPFMANQVARLAIQVCGMD